MNRHLHELLSNPKKGDSLFLGRSPREGCCETEWMMNARTVMYDQRRKHCKPTGTNHQWVLSRNGCTVVNVPVGRPGRSAIASIQACRGTYERLSTDKKFYLSDCNSAVQVPRNVRVFHAWRSTGCILWSHGSLAMLKNIRKKTTSQDETPGFEGFDA